MAVSASYAAYIEEQLSTIDGILFRKMFGGIGIFRDGVMFALISGEDRFFMRTDESTRDAFLTLGMPSFDPYGKGGSMPYHEVPVTILEDRDTLAEWAETAYQAALRNRKK